MASAANQCSAEHRLRITGQTYRSGGDQRELTVTKAYLPYDSDEPPPTKEMRDVIDYCSSRSKQLIIGCDANAHHILWGSHDINPRGESLMEYLVSSNLDILNQRTYLCYKQQEGDYRFDTRDQ
jgi:hypothetical protein